MVALPATHRRSGHAAKGQTGAHAPRIAEELDALTHDGAHRHARPAPRRTGSHNQHDGETAPPPERSRSPGRASAEEEER